MSSQILHSTLKCTAYREALRLRVVAALGPGSFRAHAEAYGVNHETLRRWLRGDTQLPAWFVAEVALRTGISAQRLLYGQEASPHELMADLAMASQLDGETLQRLKQFVVEMEDLVSDRQGRSPIPR